MSDKGQKDTTRHRDKGADERKERLAAALRQNLTRRKAQGRARKATQAEDHDAEDDET